MNIAPSQQRRTFLLTVGLASLAMSLFSAELFDGKTLAGWEGDPQWWRVQDGALTGGSTTEKIPRNFFLATTKSYQKRRKAKT